MLGLCVSVCVSVWVGGVLGKGQSNLQLIEQEQASSDGWVEGSSVCWCVCGRKQQEQFISDSSSPATLQLFYSEMQFIYQHFAHIKMPQILQRPLKHQPFFTHQTSGQCQENRISCLQSCLLSTTGENASGEFSVCFSPESCRRHDIHPLQTPDTISYFYAVHNKVMLFHLPWKLDVGAESDVTPELSVFWF